MDKTFRAALVGYGQSGRSIHARLIGAVPGIEISAIVVHSDEAVRRAENDHPAASIVRTLGDLRGLDRRPDVVVVATPDDSHHDFAAGSLSSGFTTIVDKPLSWSPAAATELVELAQANGVHVIPFLNRRWDGDFLTVKSLLGTGELGRIATFESSIERWIPELGGDWRGRPHRGGLDGALGGFGSHLVDQSIALFGQVKRVYAEVDTVRMGSRVNDSVFLALEHDAGVRTHISASLIAPHSRPRFSLTGSDGGFEKYGLDGQQPALVDGEDPTNPSWGSEPAENWGILVTKAGSRRIETVLGNWTGFYRRVVEFLRTDGPLPVPVSEAVHGLAVLSAALESQRTGNTVLLQALVKANGTEA